MRSSHAPGTLRFALLASSTENTLYDSMLTPQQPPGRESQYFQTPISSMKPFPQRFDLPIPVSWVV